MHESLDEFEFQPDNGPPTAELAALERLKKKHRLNGL